MSKEIKVNVETKAGKVTLTTEKIVVSKEQFPNAVDAILAKKRLSELAFKLFSLFGGATVCSAVYGITELVENPKENFSEAASFLLIALILFSIIINVGNKGVMFDKQIETLKDFVNKNASIK